MPERIEKWKANDGKIFNTEHQADTHDSLAEFSVWISKWAATHLNAPHQGVVDKNANMLTNFLMDYTIMSEEGDNLEAVTVPPKPERKSKTDAPPPPATTATQTTKPPTTKAGKKKVSKKKSSSKK